MKTITKTLSIGILASVTAMSAQATTIFSTNDSFIRSAAEADSNFGLDSELRVKLQTNTQYTRKTYIEFDLSGAPSTSGATLELDIIDTQAGSTNANTNWDFSIFGLNNETLDGFDQSTITWNNAPGNVASSTDSSLNSDATRLGGFSLTGKGDGDILSFSSAALDNLIANDTNDLITLIIVRDTDMIGNQNYIHGFASSESETGTGPRLTFVNEPLTSAMLLIGLVTLMSRKKRRAN